VLGSEGGRLKFGISFVVVVVLFSFSFGENAEVNFFNTLGCDVDKGGEKRPPNLLTGDNDPDRLLSEGVGLVGVINKPDEEDTL